MFKDDPILNSPDSRYHQEENQEWLTDRLGMITGSKFGKLVKKQGKGFKLSESKVASDLIYKIAWERLLKEGNVSNGLGRLSVNSQPTVYGTEYESEAVAEFVTRTGIEVTYSQQFIQLNDFIGGTPDAFIGDDGILEVKCPWNGGNHLQSLLEQRIYNPEYEYQIQGYLWITDRKYCKFVTYDPDLIEELQLNVIHVDRNDEVINGIAEVMEEVKKRVQQILDNEKLKK